MAVEPAEDESNAPGAAQDERDVSSDDDNTAQNDGTRNNNVHEQNGSTSSENVASSLCEEENCFIIKLSYLQCAAGIFFSVLLGIMAVLIVLIARGPEPNMEKSLMEMLSRWGEDGVELFKSFDHNRDGSLTVSEFEPIIPHVKDISALVEKVGYDLLL